MNQDIPFEGMTPDEIRKCLETMLDLAEPKTIKERLAIWMIKFMLFLDKVKRFLGSIPSKLYAIWLQFKAFAKRVLNIEETNAVITAGSGV